MEERNLIPLEDFAFVVPSLVIKFCHMGTVGLLFCDTVNACSKSNASTTDTVGSQRKLTESWVRAAWADQPFIVNLSESSKPSRASPGTWQGRWVQLERGKFVLGRKTYKHLLKKPTQM